MQIRRWFVGAIVGTLVVLALAPVVARAAGVPEITSITPHELGSAGNFKMAVHGVNFEGVKEVHFGSVPATKIITSGTPTKGQCKVKSPTELECLTPFHECGRFFLRVTNEFGTSAETPASEIVFPCEIYRNEVAVGVTRIPLIGYGEVTLASPQIQSTFECVNLGFGAGWNQANETGKPIEGHGEILVWWTSGHAPTEEHTELSSRCRFIYHGVEGEQKSNTAWASAEPPLKQVTQEGIVCAEPGERELSSCPGENERLHETVVRELGREGLTTPWNIEFTERAGSHRTVIGVPYVCKNSEITELAVCPEPSERQPASSPEGCRIPPLPAPPGCVKVGVYSDPPLNLHMEYEGYVEPAILNSGPNGLSPGSWEFEGHEKGESALHLRESPTTEGSTTGSLKILGYSGQELISVK